MNSIRQIQELNKRELENGVSPEASWHTDYRDTAYIYIGGLPYELSEGDVITIFSQYGEPTYINLIRDKETGKSKGFAFLKYEDQRSTDLAVDNLGGTVVMGKTLKVDHTRYKKKDDKPDEGIDLTDPPKEFEDDEEGPRKRRRTSESESEAERPMIKEERELAKLVQEHDEDDPMKAYLIEQKREEVAQALARLKPSKSSKSKHKHHHRSRRTEKEGKDSRKDEHRSSRHHRDGHKSRRSRSRDRSPRESTRRRDKSPRRTDKDDSRSRRRSSSPGGERRDRDTHRREKDRSRRSRSRDGSGEKDRKSRRAYD
ncbi:hypothetical protein HYALB_00005665 [Hymenoscyphus albidus]|uniref:RRM domain-containing protein n=1 Tax=Hymenoscyphus albidus TaxID=595503 RepID=A0A9N9LH44_9HELO|nr:hypothetical protein HYALB_00005665 [Hymenoscyphus albidus]